MKLVREHINFERNQDPKRAMGIGRYQLLAIITFAIPTLSTSLDEFDKVKKKVIAEIKRNYDCPIEDKDVNLYVYLNSDDKNTFEIIMHDFRAKAFANFQGFKKTEFEYVSYGIATMNIRI